MFDLFAAADSFLRQPSGWLAILLIIMVVWLVRVVIDLRSDLTLVKQASSHNLTASFLAQYSNNAHRRQLHRIRNAAHRASKATAGSADPAAALQRFEQEVQAEIDTLEASFGPAQADAEDDPDGAFSSSSADDNDLDAPAENHDYGNEPEAEHSAADASGDPDAAADGDMGHDDDGAFEDDDAVGERDAGNDFGPAEEDILKPRRLTTTRLRARTVSDSEFSVSV
jgi:hypothetical protein